MSELNRLSKFCVDDAEKINLIKDVYVQFPEHDEINYVQKRCIENQSFYRKGVEFTDFSEDFKEISEDYKYCPECGKKYPSFENICFDCLVHLKKSSGEPDIFDIEYSSEFHFKGTGKYDNLGDLLTDDNLAKINEFRFTCDDYTFILNDLKRQALGNFDEIIKSNNIDFESLDIADKVILFAKSFTEVRYKSSGGELGYFEDGIIYVDDRQTDSLKITTLLHELSHFLLKEILAFVLCRILDVSYDLYIDQLINFILSYLHFTQLIDEYTAHNVEGRFTLFGFQDYSSFRKIEASVEGEMSRDEIEITKSIGNTFALSVKEILESVIDRDLRDQINDQFLSDTVDSPNYAGLSMENCKVLNSEGFLKAVWLILNDGFEFFMKNRDKLL